MGTINLLSMKGSFIGIIVTLILILIIPLLFLLSQQTTMFSKKPIEPTPTPVRLTFSDGATTIAGYVYNDTNHDGERKSEEKPFKDVVVQIKQLKKDNSQTTSLEAATDTYGYFSFRLPIEDQSSYMIKIVLPKGYKTVDSNPIILSDLKPNAQNIIEFGLIPSGEFIPSPTKQAPTQKPTEEISITPTP